MAKEIGQTGLSEWSGQIQEEFLAELRGKRGYKAFNEMRLNSPIIGALLLANELSIRKVSWEFASDDNTETTTDPRVDLLNAARDNLSHSWNDFMVEVLTMLPFGFSVFEIVYERVGSQVLWRKFAPRGQDTIYKWEFDDQGGLAGIVQQTGPTYKLTPIPIDKLLLFRTRVERNNPEGRSILRTAWVPYYYAKHIQQVEAIGIERDLAGLPLIKLPPGADTSDTDSSDAGKAAQIVRNVRNDEQSGLVLPPGWEFELVSTGGSRQFDTDKIVTRYEKRMLMAALAQFIMLGQDNVGSLALSKDVTDFFVMAVNAVADIISETFTKYAIPRLLKLNGYDAEGVRLEHTPAGDIDVNAVVDSIQKAGSYITWDAQDELWLRQLIGLPERDMKGLQESREEKAEMENARNKAILEQVRQRRTPQNGSGDEEEPDDEMEITKFAADPPDDRKRRQLERRLQTQIEKAMARTQRNVMKYAQEVRRTGSFDVDERGFIERLFAKFQPQPVSVNLTTHNHPGEKPSVTVENHVQPTPIVANFEAPVTVQPASAPPIPVTVINQVQPTPINNNVQPTPINNNVTVQPAPVTVEKGRRKATVKRDNNGRIIEVRTDEE